MQYTLSFFCKVYIALFLFFIIFRSCFCIFFTFFIFYFHLFYCSGIIILNEKISSCACIMRTSRSFTTKSSLYPFIGIPNQVNDFIQWTLAFHVCIIQRLFCPLDFPFHCQAIILFTVPADCILCFCYFLFKCFPVHVSCHLYIEFDMDDLKELYHLRWSKETAYRDLKYPLCLKAFHSKKYTYIVQEVFARVIIHNYCSAISQHIELPDRSRKLTAISG